MEHALALPHQGRIMVKTALFQPALQAHDGYEKQFRRFRNPHTMPGEMP
jgi:hypothetical protein